MSILKYLKESIGDSIQKLKSILQSDEAYAILDSADAGDTWCAGGCAILAFALSKYFGYEIYVIWNTDRKQVEHFVVKDTNGKFIDCDGYHDNMIKDFQEREIIDSMLVLKKYEPSMNIADIVIDQKAIIALVQLFDKEELNRRM